MGWATTGFLAILVSGLLQAAPPARLPAGRQALPPGGEVLLEVPFFPDKTNQCGPSALAGVLSFWGKPADPAKLREEMYLDKLKGTLPMDLLLTAKAHGLKTQMVRGDLDILRSELKQGRPVLILLNQGFNSLPVDHYVIVTGFHDDRKGLYMHSADEENVFVPYKKILRQWEKTDYWTLLTRT